MIDASVTFGREMVCPEGRPDRILAVYAIMIELVGDTPLIAILATHGGRSSHYLLHHVHLHPRLSVTQVAHPHCQHAAECT